MLAGTDLRARDDDATGGNASHRALRFQAKPSINTPQGASCVSYNTLPYFAAAKLLA
jgi:hypothetical protein